MAQFLKISKLQLCRNIIGINKITIHRRYASKKKDETVSIVHSVWLIINLIKVRYS